MYTITLTIGKWLKNGDKNETWCCWATKRW